METNKSNNVSKNKIIKIIFILIVSVIFWVGFTKAGYIPNFLDSEVLCPANQFYHRGLDYGSDHTGRALNKPVIYLYPEHKQNTQVKLNFNGKIIADYPKYDKSKKGWDVIVYPNGKIINQADNQEYSYLFWEGQLKEDVNWDFSKGFIVKGKNIKEFFQQILPKIGLTPKEYNEFIVYWYPLMQNNKYNLIHFANKKYTDNAKLTINPKPNSMLRVFMVYKALEKPIKIKKQEIKPFERRGFTVIEWGGAKVK